MELFFFYDKGIARAITRDGKRTIRKLLKELDINYDWEQDATNGNAR